MKNKQSLALNKTAGCPKSTDSHEIGKTVTQQEGRMIGFVFGNVYMKNVPFMQTDGPAADGKLQ
jgi:hypothetical protein